MTAIIYSLRIAKPKIGLTSLSGCWLPTHPFFLLVGEGLSHRSHAILSRYSHAQLSPRLSFVAMARLPTATSDCYRLLPSPVIVMEAGTRAVEHFSISSSDLHQIDPRK